MPVSLVSSKDLLAFGIEKNRLGWGTLIGKAVPGTELKVIRNEKGPIGALAQASELGPLQVGEIVVKAKQVTSGYFGDLQATSQSKFADAEGGLWHRMGDVGYFDKEQNLWFCGRKDHVVSSDSEHHYSVPCESIFNRHPEVKRTALIGLGDAQDLKPCLVIERCDLKKRLSAHEAKTFRDELLALGRLYSHTRTIQTFYLYDSFPVDPRHNIKIDRLALRDYFQNRQEEAL